MSPLDIHGSNRNNLQAAAAVQPRDSALSSNELNQSIPVSVKDDEAAEDEDFFVVEGSDQEDNINKALSRESDEEVKMVEDPKVKASAILKSVFGEDAEDAISYDGALSEGDAISEE